MDWTGIAAHIVLYLLGLVGAGVGVAVTNFINQRTKGVKNAILSDLLGMVSQAAGDAVNATYQTAVNDLKAASADGKLTAEEARAAAGHALESAWAALAADAKADLAKFFGGAAGAQKVVAQAVESKVAQAKAAGVDAPSAKVQALAPDQKQKVLDQARVQLGLSVK